MPKVLVIDDEKTILDNIKFVLEIEDYQVITASSGQEGISLFKENMFIIDVVITDMKMPHMSGMEVLREIKALSPETCVIVLTGHGDMENAILAMKEGAFEYLKKPVNVDNLIIAINNAATKRTLVIENQRMQNEIMEYNSYLKSLLDSAQKIILNMLPKSLPEIPEFKFALEYKSSDAVGGDMYNVFDTGDRLYFYVFDVSSHGILASLITIILKSFIQNMEYNCRQGINIKDLTETVSDLNVELIANTGQSVFATLFFGYIEKNTKTMHFVSAGHINQFVSCGGELLALPSTGTVLGVFEEASYSLGQLPLNKGDKILLFTDGITEATSPQGELFSEERVLDILKNNKQSDIGIITQNTIASVKEFSNDNMQDDVTILGIEVI